MYQIRVFCVLPFLPQRRYLDIEDVYQHSNVVDYALNLLGDYYLCCDLLLESKLAIWSWGNHFKWLMNSSFHHSSLLKHLAHSSGMTTLFHSPFTFHHEWPQLKHLLFSVGYSLLNGSLSSSNSYYHQQKYLKKETRH